MKRRHGLPIDVMELAGAPIRAIRELMPASGPLLFFSPKRLLRGAFTLTPNARARAGSVSELRPGGGLTVALPARGCSPSSLPSRAASGTRSRPNRDRAGWPLLTVHEFR